MQVLDTALPEISGIFGDLIGVAPATPLYGDYLCPSLPVLTPGPPSERTA